MSDKLAKQFNENREIAEENISAKISQTNTRDKLNRQLIRLGMVAGVGRIAQTLSAQTIRALQKVRDDKDFEALGFSRFDDFLDESDISPMTYRQFNDREKLLETEGDDVFDLMNTLKLSHRQRKMLGAGHVQIDEAKGTVIIVTDKDGEENIEEIELVDRSRLLQTLSALADQNATLNAKTNKQKEKIERGEKEIEGLQKKLDSGSFSGKGESAHFGMFMSVLTPFNQMTDSIKKMTVIEKVEIHEQGLIYLRSLNSALARLAQAYGHKQLQIGFDEDASEKSLAKKVKRNSEDVSDENEFASITADLNDDELEELMD